jgi:hypothetical protein
MKGKKKTFGYFSLMLRSKSKEKCAEVITEITDKEKAKEGKRQSCRLNVFEMPM